MSIRSDVRDILRRWRRYPWAITVAVLSISLALAANTAVFALVNALFLRPIADHDAGILVTLAEQQRAAQNTRLTERAWSALSLDHPGLRVVAAFATQSVDTADEGSTIQPTRAAFVSGSYFEVMGVVAQKGRLVRTEDQTSAQPLVAVISDAYWTARFGRDPSVVGANITIERQRITIIGIVDRGFIGLDVGRPLDILLPLSAHRLLYPGGVGSQPNAYWLNVVGCVDSALSIAEAQARLRSVQLSIARTTLPLPALANVHLADPWTLTQPDLATTGVRSEYRESLRLLSSIAGLVLLIACMNAAVLMMATGDRQRLERAVRTSLGAVRADLVRSVIVEHVFLSALATAVGVPIGRLLAHALVAEISTPRSPVSLDLSTDWRVAGFTVAVAVVTVLLAGGWPVLRARDVDTDNLMLSGRMTRTRRLTKGTHALLAVQIALAFVLVVVATAMTASVRNLAGQPYGFDSGHVTLVSVSLSRMGRLSTERRAALAQQLRDRINTMSDVTSVSLATSPVFGGAAFSTRVDNTQGEAIYNIVTPSYFETMGIAILGGVAFVGKADEMQLVINEAFAERFLPREVILGRSIRLSAFPERVFTVSGLVGNTKFQSIRDQASAIAYLPWTERTAPPGSVLQLQVRTRSNLLIDQRAVVRAVDEVAAGAAVDARPVDVEARLAITRERTLLAVSSMLGGFALSLAVLGLAASASLHVKQRRRDVAIHMAVGAPRSALLRFLLKRLALVCGIGLALGLVGVAWASRLTAALLYDVTTLSAEIIGIAAAVLVSVIGLAVLIPAWRAASCEPVSVLREAD